MMNNNSQNFIKLNSVLHFQVYNSEKGLITMDYQIEIEEPFGLWQLNKHKFVLQH